MGLAIAAGARILAYNPNLTSVGPQTMEELRVEARRISGETDACGLIIPARSTPIGAWVEPAITQVGADFQANTRRFRDSTATRRHRSSSLTR